MRSRTVVRLLLVAALWPALAWAQTPPPAGTIEYYHVDALGSVRAVTDTSGAVVRTHHYHPFGEAVGAESGTDPLRFTGKPRDAETGLDYFGARYYAGRTGRFTTVDPALNSAALLNPERWNRYAYAGNNPVRFYDPDGKDFWERLAGTANAIASNFGFAPRVQTASEDFRAGQSAGDAASVFIGAIEAVAGGAIAAGGLAVSPSGVGAPVGAVAAAAGGAMVAHGAAGSLSGVVKMASADGGRRASGSSLEVTPSTDASQFESVRGSSARKHSSTGEIWVQDKFHKNHYEVYKNKKDFEKGVRDRAVWQDGRLKTRF